MKSTLRSRTPWREKMEKPADPRVVQIPHRWEKQQGAGTMLIATPRLIDDIVKRTPKGKLLTIGQIRVRLTKDFGTNTTCPLTTGIFARIVAETANEQMNEGKVRITPFWRLIRDDGSLMEKFPGGATGQAKMLRKEGHMILAGIGRKQPRVKDHERHLVKL